MMDTKSQYAKFYLPESSAIQSNEFTIDRKPNRISKENRYRF